MQRVGLHAGSVKITNPRVVLGVLTTLNLLNYLDRYVMAAVLDPVQKEFGLDNGQGGLLGTIFLAGYFVSSPLFGRWADHVPRKYLMGLGVAIWSLATLGSGLSTGGISLLIARAMVGVGEASFATLAPTVIDDVAPEDKKGRWLAIFFLATPVGSALGYITGGLLAKAFGWRHAFLLTGGPGLLLMVGCFLIAEPIRKLSTEKPSLVRSGKLLAKVPLYVRGVLGYSAYTAAVGAFSYWAPKFIINRYGLDVGKANLIFGALTVVGGAVGTAIGGTWADRQSKAVDATRAATGGVDVSLDEKRRVNGLLRICATGSLIAAPLAVVAFLAPTATIFFIAVFLCEIALFLSTSPINGVVLRSVPTALRAAAMAGTIFAIHMFGDLWSPAALGFMAKALPMTVAMMILPVLILLSAGIWWPRAAEAQPEAADQRS